MKIEDHIKNHKLNSFRFLEDKIIIYLDTKYWLILLEQSNETIAEKRLLLDKIIELSNSGKCIFPISEVLFYEFKKQSDPKTLNATFKLADKLSQGISIININEIRHLEFRCYLNSILGKQEHNVKELIWTKFPPHVGYDIIDKLNNENDQKSLFDFLTNLSFSEINSMLDKSGKISDTFKYKDDIEALNRDKLNYVHENSTFDEIFLSEQSGFLEFFETIFIDELYDIYRLKYDKETISEEKESVENNFKYIIYNLFKKEKLTYELPSLSIIPKLFAIARREINRKYKDGNDLLDFMHASLALPYCDYFFTENDLKSMIIKTKIDQSHKCIVESKPKLALDILNKL